MKMISRQDRDRLRTRHSNPQFAFRIRNFHRMHSVGSPEVCLIFFTFGSRRPVLSRVEQGRIFRKILLSFSRCFRILFFRAGLDYTDFARRFSLSCVIFGTKVFRAVENDRELIEAARCPCPRARVEGSSRRTRGMFPECLTHKHR